MSFGLVVVACLIIVTWFIIFLVGLKRTYKKEKEVVECMNSVIIADWDNHGSIEDQMWANYIRIGDTLKKKKNEQLYFVWREFEESLVPFYERKEVKNTLDSHHFFNEDVLAPSIFTKDVYKVTPNVLVGLGVMLTFLGLIIGIWNIDVSSSNATDLQQDVGSIIEGAKLAFSSSIAGILCSIVFVLAHSWFKTKLKERIRKLQNHINFKFVRTPPEKSLVEIQDYSEQQMNHLAALSTTIGDKLQEVIRGISDDLKTEIGTMSTELQSLFKNLTSKTMQTAETSLDSLVDRFIEKVGASVKEQQELLRETNQKINESLVEFNNRFLLQVEGIKEVIDKLNNSYHVLEESLVGRFTEVTFNLEKGINQFLDYQKILDSQLIIQRDINDEIQKIVNSFSLSAEKFSILHEEIKNIQKNYTTSSENLEIASESLEKVSQTNNLVTEKMTEAIGGMTEPINRLKDVHNQMLDKVNETMARMSEKMNNALNDYFKQVEDQTVTRMDQWNKQTTEFSTAMLGVAKELNHSVDTFTEKRLEDYSESVKVQKDSIEEMNKWTEQSKIFALSMEKFATTISNISDNIKDIEDRIDSNLQTEDSSDSEKS